MGPVQVLVIGVDEVAFTGEVLAELSRLRSAGIVRLLDVLVIARHEDGTFETVADPTAMTPRRGELAAALLGSGDGDSAAMTAEIADLSRLPSLVARRLGPRRQHRCYRPHRAHVGRSPARRHATRRRRSARGDLAGDRGRPAPRADDESTRRVRRWDCAGWAARPPKGGSATHRRSHLVQHGLLTLAHLLCPEPHEPALLGRVGGGLRRFEQPAAEGCNLLGVALAATTV